MRQGGGTLVLDVNFRFLEGGPDMTGNGLATDLDGDGRRQALE
jgi:hypothetical protein